MSDLLRLIGPTIIKETKKAYLIEFGEGIDLQQMWFPMSVVYPEYEEELGKGILLNVYVDKWFIEKEEIDVGIDEGGL